MAPATGLRPRRADEDRNRQSPHSLGRAQWRNHRIADRDPAGKQGLEKLAGIASRSRKGIPPKHKRVASPRPGHADLAGALKYNFSEARYVLERASARESAARVAVGGLAKLLLRELGIEVLSHVVAVGAASLKKRRFLGADSRPLGAGRSSAELRRPRSRAADEGRSRQGAANRGFRRRRF